MKTETPALWHSESYVSTHLHFIVNYLGEMIDMVPFCSDYCHQQWCQDTSAKYGGWNGCQETQLPAICACCQKNLGV